MRSWLHAAHQSPSTQTRKSEGPGSAAPRRGGSVGSAPGLLETILVKAQTPGVTPEGTDDLDG